MVEVNVEFWLGMMVIGLLGKIYFFLKNEKNKL